MLLPDRGGAPEKLLYVAEGFATAATVHEATGSAVAFTFNANNLKSIAKALREKFANLEMVIFADDDHQTKGNPGIKKAIEASTATHSKVLYQSLMGIEFMVILIITIYLCLTVLNL